jgi:hypothetical protein
MKRDGLIRLGLIAFVAAVFSYIVAGLVFSSPKTRSTEVPVAQPLSTTFPDVRHDPNYSFFVNNPLDPTVPIQIGNSQNTAPFTGSGSQ